MVTCPRTRSRWRRRLLDSVSAIGRTRIDQVATRKQPRGNVAGTQCARCSGRRPARSLALCAIGGPSPTVTGGAARAVHCWPSRASLLEAGDHLPAYRPGLTQVFHIARERGSTRHQMACIEGGRRPICGGAPWRHGRLSQARRTRCCLPPHALGSPPQAIGDRCRWGMCADGRSADISDRPFGQRVDTSESLGIELPIPSAAPPLSRELSARSRGKSDATTFRRSAIAWKVQLQ